LLYELKKTFRPTRTLANGQRHAHECAHPQKSGGLLMIAPALALREGPQVAPLPTGCFSA
jgi:hypothetical protein